MLRTRTTPEPRVPPSPPPSPPAEEDSEIGKHIDLVINQGKDLDGNPIEEHAEGLRAVCIQHEFDHLDGILFIDRISRLKRNLYVKKRKKQLSAEQA